MRILILIVSLTGQIITLRKTLEVAFLTIDILALRNCIDVVLFSLTVVSIPLKRNKSKQLVSLTTQNRKLY